MGTAWLKETPEVEALGEPPPSPAALAQSSVVRRHLSFVHRAATADAFNLKDSREEFPPHLFSRPLTDVGHVQAVLLGGVVPGGGGSRHVHAVGAPHGGVAAVEVAAVGPGRPVVRTLLPEPVSADTRGDGDASPHTIPGLPDHVMDKLFLRRPLAASVCSSYCGPQGAFGVLSSISAVLKPIFSHFHL